VGFNDKRGIPGRNLSAVSQLVKSLFTIDCSMGPGDKSFVTPPGQWYNPQTIETGVGCDGRYR